QFVDDNNEGQFFIDDKPADFPEKIPANGGHYYPIMTQSLSTKSLNPYVQKYVYVPFHFIPGDNSVLIDGKKNPLSTTPGSPNATAVLKKALASDNSYQLGIALHTYADTWSHQNFTGLQEGWNSVYPWYNFFKSIVPNIGHAEAGHSPDVISEEWTDHRLGEKVINRRRAFRALAEIYKAMRLKSRTGPLWKDILGDLRQIVNAAGYDDRKEKINDLLTERGLGSVPKYSKDDWIDAALDREEGQIVMHQKFEETDWFRFHQAAKVQFALVLELTKEI
ncbi:MAG: DUF6765 family protein, partial [Pseudomonadota bacterium]